jgi:diguanylate cyclase (GGDEF)-like protein
MNLATSESSTRSRRTALIASVAMACVAIAATAFGRGEAVTILPILPLFVGCVIVSEMMSAYVLFHEFVQSRLAWLPFIAAAYLLTAVATIPYILAFPAVFAPAGWLGASAQTAVHLWILWHLAFPALLLGAVFIGRFPRDVQLGSGSAVPLAIALTVAACVAVGCIAPLVSTALGPHLPELVWGRTFTPAMTRVVLPFIVALDLVALVMISVRSRLRTSISLLLCLAIFASALEAAVSTLSSRYSYGWYVGKVFLVVSSSVMLVGFIGEISRLRMRLGWANETLRRTRERERHLAQERVHRLAYYDALTGLANRNGLEERLRTLAAVPPPGSTFAVLFLSLDCFKEVNDHVGHVAADLVLNEVASRLRSGVRLDDMVARFSGDEFVVVASSLSAPDGAEALADILREAIRNPIERPDGPLAVTASVGIALFPQDAASGDDVLDKADAAARQAKAAGGNATRAYSREFVEQTRARRRLQEDLSLALLREEFVLLYQPIVDLRTGAMTKVEALIRWMHPERGMVTPDAFIPLAEQTGLMQLIGYWVIEEAVRQASVWEASGTPLRVAVNVSARQLDDAGFMAHLQRTLEAAHLRPQLLELEITESAAMTDASLAQDVLERCRALGLTIALDDFGTYYSSLTYLKRLPIDTVKIDRSFVAGLPFVKSDVAIVSGILGLARALERTAVAEGIETEQQRSWLARAGCEYGQGYFFARPMLASALPAWREGRKSPTTLHAT